MNSSMSQATEHTSAFLTFGRELRTPREVLDDFRSVVNDENVVSELMLCIRKIANTMKEVREIHEKQQDI